MNTNHGEIYLSHRNGRMLMVDGPTGYWKVVNQASDSEALSEFKREVEEHGNKPPAAEAYNSDIYPLECVLYLTNKCNMGCDYCYSKTVRNLNWSSFELDALEKAIDIIFAEKRRNRLNFLFFGGETLLAVKQMRFAINHINKINQEYQKEITFSMTTNGTLVNDEIIQLIKDHKINVTISFDGPQELQDSQRQTLKNIGTHAKVMKTIAIFKEHGIRFGTISTVGSPERMEEVYDYFIEEKITNRIKISPVIPEGAAKEYQLQEVSQSEYSQLWGQAQMKGTRKILEHNKKSDYKFQEGNVVSMISHLVMDHRPDLCLRSPCAASGGMIEFHPDGTFVTCDKTLYSPELGVISNLKDMKRDDSLLEIIEESPLVEKIRSRTVDNIPKCSKCAFRSACGGSCTLGAYDYYGSFYREDSMCEYREVMFEELMWLLSEDKENLANLGVN